MENYFDEKTLSQSSIFELRNIARELGVYSPTIYKKEELIHKMMQIVNGEVAPHVPKSKQGRPPKSMSSSKVIDAFLPTQADLEDTFSLSVGDKTLILGEHTRAFLEDASNKPKSVENKCGFLTITEEGYGLIRDPKHFNDINYCIYISKAQILTHNLKEGDYICAVCKVLSHDKPSIFVEATSINSQSSKIKSRVNFEDMPVEYPVNKFEFDVSKLDSSLHNALPNLLGDCVLVLNNKTNKIDISTLIKQANENTNYAFVNISLEVLKGKEIFLTQLSNVESFYTLLDNTPSQHCGVVYLALQRAKRLVETGKDVVLIVDSLDKIIKNQNLKDGNNLLDLTTNSFDLPKTILGSARKIVGQGSLSVIALINYKPNNHFDQTIIDEFEGAVNNIVYLS